jgi:hypothetical protein
MSDEQKLEQFGKSFVRLSELTIDIIAGCISKIETPNGTTDDTEQIKEFIHNSPRDIFDKISDHISGLKKEIEFKPVGVKCSECEHEFEMPITMDQSNFFGVRS